MDQYRVLAYNITSCIQSQLAMELMKSVSCHDEMLFQQTFRLKVFFFIWMESAHTIGAEIGDSIDVLNS